MEVFYFRVCSLSDIDLPVMHSDERDIGVSLSFSMPLVWACSPTSPEGPLMFWALSFTSFLVFFSKGSCFSLVICFHWHTHCVLLVPLLLLCVPNFKKLPLYPSLLFQLSALCLDHYFRRCPQFRFVIFVVFLCHPLKCSALLFFSPPVSRLPSSNFQKLLLYVDLLFPFCFHRFQ